MGGGVWFIAEARRGELSTSTLGLAAAAQQLAERLGTPTAALLLGGDAALAGRTPADTVYLYPRPAACAAAQVDAIAALVRRQRPDILLAAASPFAQEIAARLAARLGTGLASGCLRLDLNSDGILLMVRPAYGGRASCTVVCATARPQMATLIPDCLAPTAAAGGPAEVVAVDIEPASGPTPLLVERVFRPVPDSLDVGEAEVVVAGGRGVGGPEGFRLLTELASLLGGTVAASRPAVDAGWAPYDRQVGASGKLVAPRLYIACGISGAGQHLVGMRGSRLVVAVNQDPYAPILSLADLSLVGDLHQVLPAVLAALRSQVEPSPATGDLAEAPSTLPPPSDGLHVAVCLSGCVDPDLPLDFRAGVDLGGLPRVLSPADAHALEAALAMKDACGEGRVTALSLGPPAGEALLRPALAAGADRAFLLSDEAVADSDTLATARILAAGLRRLAPHLVLCGVRSPDGDTGQLPVQLAELLGWPFVPQVVSVAAGDGEVRVQRRLPAGRRALIRCRLPAVLAVERGINRLRYPPLRARLAAALAPVEQWGLQRLGLSPQAVGACRSAARVIAVGPPKPAGKGLFAPDESLPAQERWQQLLGGGATQGRDNLVRGPPELLAGRLIELLNEHGFVENRSRV